MPQPPNSPVFNVLPPVLKTWTDLVEEVRKSCPDVYEYNLQVRYAINDLSGPSEYQIDMLYAKAKAYDEISKR